MVREGLDEGTEKVRRVAAVAVAVFAMAAVVTSPAHAQGSESFAAALETEPPPQWPAFSVALDDGGRPPVFGAQDNVPGSAFKSTTAVSAPLPQAVATGLFMLAGNWIGTHLWKKRKL